MAFFAALGAVEKALNVIGWFRDSGEKKRSESMGGYVTHIRMNEELKNVYQYAREEATREASRATESLVANITELIREVKELRQAINRVDRDLAHLDGVVDAATTTKKPR